MQPTQAHPRPVADSQRSKTTMPYAIVMLIKSQAGVNF